MIWFRGNSCRDFNTTYRGRSRSRPQPIVVTSVWLSTAISTGYALSCAQAPPLRSLPITPGSCASRRPTAKFSTARTLPMTTDKRGAEKDRRGCVARRARTTYRVDPRLASMSAPFVPSLALPSELLERIRGRAAQVDRDNVFPEQDLADLA